LVSGAGRAPIRGTWIARPSSRPYAEYRVRDPENNGVDLSKTKGWEIDLGKWETAA
jgi:hypothetical protein